MSRRLLLWMIILLIAALGLLIMQPFKDPSTVSPAADNTFSDTLSSNDDGFDRALRPRKFSFPDDFGAHEDYRTEWWYFTGNLQDLAGHKFGYQLTFFRFALAADIQDSKSAWRTRQLYMAHLTLTDVAADRFYSDERFSRAGNALAGARNDRYQVWLHDWSASAEGDAKDFPIRLKAGSGAFALDLTLQTKKDVVLQGDRGLSQKSAEPGNASYYYSYTRMITDGAITVNGETHAVTGASWMDREWSTSALSKQQSGWDWFALQLSDDSELMYYRFRRKDGQPDSHSSGALFPAERKKIPLAYREVSLHILDSWQSPHSKITYPSRWRLTIPSRNLVLDVVPLINDQELNLSYRYWEGAVSVRGISDGKEIQGQGYVELTGY